MVSFIALVITGRREALKGSADIRMMFNNGVITLENHGPLTAMAVGISVVTSSGAAPLKPVGDLAVGQTQVVPVKIDQPKGTLYLQWSIGGSRNRVKKYRIREGSTSGDGYPTLLEPSLALRPGPRRRSIHRAYLKNRVKQFFY